MTSADGSGLRADLQGRSRTTAQLPDLRSPLDAPFALADVSKVALESSAADVLSPTEKCDAWIYTERPQARVGLS